MVRISWPPIVGTLVLSLALSIIARWGGERFHLITARGVAAIGGVGVIAAWWVAALVSNALSLRAALGLGIATAIIIAIGLWDTRRPLHPFSQLLAQLLVSVSAVVISGVAASYVTNPFGGLLYLNQWMWNGMPLLGAAFTIIWILALMNAVNFLDGMDGLAASVSTIGFLTIGAVSLLPQVNEPHIALPAFLAAAATVGFLFWNLPPARLVLGTTGAWFLGFLLAVLSVQGSSKIATLAVVGAIPLLDAVSVIIARLRRGTSPFKGDRTHLHHRLLNRGWSPRAILAFYTVVSVILALAAVYLPTPVKVLLFAMSGIAVIAFSSIWRTHATLDK